MQDDKNKIEAVLFTTGRFLSLEELSKLCGITSVGYLKEVLQELKKNYELKDSALEVLEQEDRWRLNIRKNYLYLTQSLLTDSELDKPTQETLAVIAYKNPASQSEIIKIRGNTAYDHIKILKEYGFIISEPMGRTRILKLASKFYDYFDIVENQLRNKIQELVNKENKVEANNEAQNSL